jgi:hypothetical protein
MEVSQAAPKREASYDIWGRITAISSLALAVVGLLALWMTERQILEMQREARDQITEMRAENQVQHLTALIDKFDSPDQVALRKTLAEKRIDKVSGRLRELDVDNPPAEFDTELGFCDDIGLLTERGYLNVHDVWNSFGEWLFYLYADARPYLDSLRSPADFRECSNLVDHMIPIEKNEGASTYDHPSEDELYSNYLEDIERQSGQPPSRGRTLRKSH